MPSWCCALLPIWNAWSTPLICEQVLKYFTFKIRVWNRTWNVDSWSFAPSGTYLMLLKTHPRACISWLYNKLPLKLQNLPLFSIFISYTFFMKMMSCFSSFLLFKPPNFFYDPQVEKNWSYFWFILLLAWNWVKQLKYNIHAENCNNEKFLWVTQRAEFYLLFIVPIIVAVLAFFFRKVLLQCP